MKAISDKAIKVNPNSENQKNTQKMMEIIQKSLKINTSQTDNNENQRE